MIPMKAPVACDAKQLDWNATFCTGCCLMFDLDQHLYYRMVSQNLRQLPWLDVCRVMQRNDTIKNAACMMIN